MSWLAEICVRRPIFALMMVAALIVAGVTAFPQLGVDRFPSMDLPTIYVRCNYPGSASEEVESEVTSIIEDAVATVAGIEELRSISRDGQSFVIITFSLERDVDAATQDVRDAVAAAAAQLPPGMDPPVVEKSDLDSSPVMTLTVSGPRSARELFVLADNYVKNVIESSSGVGEVSIRGATDRAVKVEIDADRLAAHQLSILEVREAIARQNTEVPGGRIDEGLRERSLRTMGRLQHSRDFPDLVVASVEGTPIRLSDLGTVSDATKEVRTLARLNGVPAVVLRVQRQSGANTVAVIEGIQKLLPKCQELLPDDVRVQVVQDQSRYIVAALEEIEQHLISGSLLACITVLIFMRSWRSTVIAAVAIPASIVATFAFMRWFGFTLNNVTMLALVLMVGVVIDDAIVVLENIFHCIEEKGLAPGDAAIQGTREIGLAVLATTLSLVIVFLPVSFLSSVTGRMLYQFGVTATVAILVSMFVSFTLTPMMCSRMLRRNTAADTTVGQQHGNPASRRGFYGLIESVYLWLLAIAMRFRWAVLLLSLLVMAANIPLYQLVRQDYIPLNVDESEFEVRLEARQGASLATMRETVELVESRLEQIEGLETVLTSMGATGFGSVNRADMFVRLVDSSERTFSLGRLVRAVMNGDPGAAFRGNFSQRDKMSEIRNSLKSIGGIQPSVRNLTSLRQGAPVDIDFSITGPDSVRLLQFADRLKERAAAIPGIVDVVTTLRIDNPELLARIDRERAASMGVDVREVADTLRIAVGGDDRVSRYRDASVSDAYDVELRLVGLDRGDVESISQLYVRIRNGANLPQDGMIDRTAVRQQTTRLDNLVSFEYHESASRIDRLNRQRMVAVRANIDSGYALGDRIAAMQAAAEELGIPDGFSTQVLGGGRELERTLEDFKWTFLLSFIFMYIVLAAQFENLVHPFVILLSLPLAVPFGLLSLHYGDESLNLYSAMGLLVLFGVVKKAAILQVDRTNALCAEGMNRDDAIMQANRDRLRPILMTTVSFVAGLLPLLIATGPGAEERRSIAVLAVGGQTFSLLLTLLAIPVLYSFCDDLARIAHRWSGGRTTADLFAEQPDVAAGMPGNVTAVAATKQH